MHLLLSQKIHFTREDNGSNFVGASWEITELIGFFQILYILILLLNGGLSQSMPLPTSP